MEDDSDPFFSETYEPRRSGRLEVRQHLQPAPVDGARWAMVYTRGPDGRFYFTSEDWEYVDEILVRGEA